MSFIPFSLIFLLAAAVPSNTSFTIVHRSYGGHPPPIGQDGGICFQIDERIITSTGVSRTIKCSPDSFKRENQVVYQSNDLLLASAAAEIAAAIASILTEQPRPNTVEKSLVGDDWTSELIITSGGANFSYKGLRHSSSLPSNIEQILKTSERLLP